ncbi:type 4 prepilin peptidase 1 [Volucribacter psittacicida]|uniref:Type 4 prepilin peptidase 1 n=1 Tax=Volucribacter psittacicida TaxID=203482 RepID=A0A4R1G2P9_9PAST|nr:A24 family peptidase [Volucribacter psittacicida]TCJ97971.1 type 4 prepilin peptidase 1 [Volucribacter psittacicida]
MNLIFAGLWGGIMGIIIHYLCQSFMYRLKYELSQSYQLLFEHKNDLSIQHRSLSFSHSLKCGHFWLYFFSFACLFILFFLLIEPWQYTIIYCLFISITGAISIIDWQHRLISLSLCQCLLWLSLIVAWLEWHFLSLEQVLTSIMLGFSCCYLLYYLSRWIWQKEALGRGDYWLVAGLVGFIPYSELPLFFFIASSMGLSYAFYQYLRGNRLTEIPFAPFLSLSAAFLLFFKL